MVKKWVFVVGAGIGYILGTRAGRDKYNAMTAQAREFLDKPEVKEATTAVQAEAGRLYREGKDAVREKVRQLHLRNESTTESIVESTVDAPTVPAAGPSANGSAY
jgi:hypothetical protein